jgi:hypothetical protein
MADDLVEKWKKYWNGMPKSRTDMLIYQYGDHRMINKLVK